MRMIVSDAQRAIEFSLGKKHISPRIDKSIRENPEIEAKVHEGVSLLHEWVNDSYYYSKNKRLEPFKSANLELLVRTTFNVVAYCLTPELFTSVAGMLSATLNLQEKKDNIQTAAEILAVLCQTDVYDITKASKNASIMIQSKIPLPDALIESVERSVYLPPMVCEPNYIRNNFDSPYLTLDKDCLVLGKGNAHTGDLCLDVLNKQNRVELRLCEEFINVMEEPIPEALTPLDFATPAEIKDRQKAIDNWDQFQKETKELSALILNQGGTCFLPHKVDKRGRIYSLGYHITTQGTGYKKAMLELANAEIVEGVPNV